MTKDGKIFGKISLIDLLAVVAVLVLILGVVVRFSGDSAVTVSTGEEMGCEVIVRGVRSPSVEALKKMGPVYDDESKEYVGEITHVEEEPAKMSITKGNGEIQEVQVKERYDVKVTISFTGNVSDEGYYTQTNRQMGVGGSLGMKTKYVLSWGTIQDVWMADDKK